MPTDKQILTKLTGHSRSEETKEKRVVTDVVEVPCEGEHRGEVI